MRADLQVGPGDRRIAGAPVTGKSTVTPSKRMAAAPACSAAVSRSAWRSVNGPLPDRAPLECKGLRGPRARPAGTMPEPRPCPASPAEPDAARCVEGGWHSTSQRHIDPASVHRELSEAIERTEALGRIIGATLDDAEKELEDIRRRAPHVNPSSRHSLPGSSDLPAPKQVDGWIPGTPGTSQRAGKARDDNNGIRPPSCGWPPAANPPAPRQRRSPDGSGPSAWRSAAPACRRARCWARRC